jgi:hypothetical protein
MLMTRPVASPVVSTSSVRRGFYLRGSLPVTRLVTQR